MSSTFEVSNVVETNFLKSTLTALRELAKTELNPGRVNCIIISHVLHTIVDYIDVIDEVYPVRGIIAIPYSAEVEAIQVLKNMGYDVYLPSSMDQTFKVAEEVVFGYLESNLDPLIIQEVGGYLADLTTKLGGYRHFLGIVEDTNNGHWRYGRQEVVGCPVLSMAKSPLKYVEDTIIGDAVVYSIERVIREEFDSILQGVRSAVIGFGKIGRSTVVALKGRESVVSVYDIDPAKNMSAKVEGYYPLPLHSLLPQSEIVIGCTGQTSIREVDIPFIKNGAILASASSKNVEFDLRGFAKRCTVNNSSHLITRYDDQTTGKHFYLLNQGFPINFRDKSVLGNILDMIYSELFVCMRFIANRKFPKGLHLSNPEIQNEVGKTWMRAHLPEFAAAVDDKVWHFPGSLKLGLKD